MSITIDASSNEATATFTGLTHAQVLAHLQARQALLNALGWRVASVSGTDPVTTTLHRTLPPGDALALGNALA